jgi:hypothetical protein
MKKHLNVFMVAALLLVGFGAQAQKSYKIGHKYTPTGEIYGKSMFRPFIGAGVQYALFRGDATAMVTGTFGVTFQNRINAGFVYNRSLAPFQPATEENPYVHYDIHYGGMQMEYIFNPGSRLNLSVPLMLGAGSMTVNEIGGSANIVGRDWDHFVIGKSGLRADYMIYPRIKLGGEVTVRMTDRVKYRGHTNSDMTNLAFALSTRYVF